MSFEYREELHRIASNISSITEPACMSLRNAETVDRVADSNFENSGL